MSTKIQANSTRPSKLKEDKDEKYHVDMARYYISASDNFINRDFLYKCAVNWMFYEGNQWIFQEDIDTFLTDSSGQVRNRIKFIGENMFKPVVRQLLGSTIQTDFSFEALPTSLRTIKRKDEKKNEMLAFSDVASKHGGAVGEYLQQNFPIGKDRMETEEIFDKHYVDDVQKGTNFLLKFIASRNDFESKKVQLVPHMVLSGIGIMKGEELLGHQKWTVKDPSFFIKDINAMEPDLSDSEYMGDFSYDMPVDIFSQYPEIGNEKMKAMEDYAKSDYKTTFEHLQQYLVKPLTGRVPRYYICWKDGAYQEFGYVKDKFGNEFFTRVNDEFVNDYTDKDLVIPSRYGNGYEEELNGKKKFKRWIEEIRYCDFVPKEFLIGGQSNTDLVLDYGVLEFQETDLNEPSVAKFPYKVATMSYRLGKIYSIMDDVIDPQRMINRMMSAAEAEVNNARGSGTIFDKSSLGDMDEEELQLRTNNSENIIIDSNNLGVNNVVGSYDSNIKEGTLVKFKLAEQVKTMIQSTTAINDQMTGQGGGKRELVGVTESMIQRGTTMQEDFFYAIGSVLKQAYQSMARSGKLIYVRKNNLLTVIAGDKAEKLFLSKDYLLEDYYLTIKRTAPEQSIIASNNLAAVQMLSMGLLDQERLAKLWNSSDASDLKSAMLSFAYEKEKMEQAAAKAAKENAQIQKQEDNDLITSMNDMRQESMAIEQMNKENDAVAGIVTNAMKK